MALAITTLRVIATTGANKRPSYGEATFDDGRTYAWLVLPSGAIAFTGERKRHGTWERFSFTSPARRSGEDAIAN
jgi:hypothetical protein